MAIGTSVPPRAYTREILTTAFNWLQTQPDAVRAKATTPDALVGLFTQAQRGSGNRPDSSFETEAPVSSQSFMSDLKNLAEGLKEFDDSRSHRQYSAPAQAYLNPHSEQAPAVKAAAPTAATAPAQAAPAMTTPAMTATIAAPVVATFVPATTGPSSLRLNDRSVAILREVQTTMNLSSEIEAMNMMIALAYKNLKAVLA